MTQLPNPRSAIAAATESADALKWRLAVLSDCYTQRGEGNAAIATLLFDQATEICARLKSLARECEGGQPSNSSSADS